MSKSHALLSNKRFMQKYNADPYLMWDKPAIALRHARCQRKLPHPCITFERVYSARHGEGKNATHNVRNTYMERIQHHQKKNGLHISAFGFWRPKDRLHVTLPDGTITLRAFVV